MVNECKIQEQRRLYKRLTPFHKIVHDDDSGNDTDDGRIREKRSRRGRHLVATSNISKGQLVFCERPMVCLQSTGNVYSGVLVCHYCMSFCGSPSQSLEIAANPSSLPTITTAKHEVSNSTQNEQELDSSSRYALISCRYYCGHVYCSIECQQDDWMWGGHEQLCTGCIGNDANVKSDEQEQPNESSKEEGSDGNDENKVNDGAENDDGCTDDTNDHPLLQFKRHAIESNEIFLLIAVWIARIHRHLDLQKSLGNSSDEAEDIDPRHPYVDFCMNPWWEVACLPYQNKPLGFGKAITLEQSLKRLCSESCSYLQAAWKLHYSQQEQGQLADVASSEIHLSSSWLTPLGMSKLIGSIEQNCMGIRRKHAIRQNIMEDSELRLKHHQRLIACLEHAGMIGDDDDDDDDQNTNVEEDDVAANEDELVQLDGNHMVPSDTSRHDSDEKKESTDNNEVKEQTSNSEEQAGLEGVSSLLGPNEEWDYTPDEIAEFLAELPTPLTQGADDDWDVLFSPLDGTAMYSTACKMNHSCEPNVVLAYKTRGWGRDHPLVASCVALRDIAEGEELTISYILSDDDYAVRQEALMNYGFVCDCGKCQRERKSVEPLGRESTIEGSSPDQADTKSDDDDLFGSDDDDEDGGNDESNSEIKTFGEDKLASSKGESKLSALVERLTTVENQSNFGSIPLPYLAPTSAYVIQLASTLHNDSLGNSDKNAATEAELTDSRRTTLASLVQQCKDGIQNRDFALCRIIGEDLESTLYNQLNTNGSWPDTWFRHAYWCGCIVAAIGYAHIMSFLIAIKYLDKASIMGQDRKSIEDIFSYIELHAFQMAGSPCPPAIHGWQILNYGLVDSMLIETIRSVGLSQPIRSPVEEWRCADVSPENSIAKQLSSRSSPLFLTKVAKDWPATQKWLDLSSLVSHHGHRLVPVEVGSITTGMKERLVSFRSFVSDYLAPSTARPCWSIEDATTMSTEFPVAYLAQHPLLDQIEVLYDDVLTEPFGVQPTNINVWMGTGGTRTPLHFDSYDNLLVQLVGAKYVRLYAPCCAPNLYVNKEAGGFGSQGNMSEVDCELEDYQKHPLVKGCEYQEVLLLPGDCLYIPAGYWHYVRSLSTSISVNYWF